MTGAASRLAVKVVPKASRSELTGWMGDALKVRVTAPPEHGKANAAVIALLASALGVARERIRVASGAAREHKIIAVDGLSPTELRDRVDRALAGLRHPR